MGILRLPLSLPPRYDPSAVYLALYMQPAGLCE